MLVRQQSKSFETKRPETSFSPEVRDLSHQDQHHQMLILGWSILALIASMLMACKIQKRFKQRDERLKLRLNCESSNLELLKLSLGRLMLRLNYESSNLELLKLSLQQLILRLNYESFNLELLKLSLGRLKLRLNYESFNLELLKLSLGRLKLRLNYESFSLELLKLILEPIKCLLEKQHRFSSKMHSIELHRARLERVMPIVERHHLNPNQPSKFTVSLALSLLFPSILHINHSNNHSNTNSSRYCRCTCVISCNSTNRDRASPQSNGAIIEASKRRDL